MIQRRSSHQGFFSLELARHCRHVLGLEYQQRHVDSANLMKEALGVNNANFVREGHAHHGASDEAGLRGCLRGIL